MSSCFLSYSFITWFTDVLYVVHVVISYCQVILQLLFTHQCFSTIFSSYSFTSSQLPNSLIWSIDQYDWSISLFDWSVFYLLYVHYSNTSRSWECSVDIQPIIESSLWYILLCCLTFIIISKYLTQTVLEREHSLTFGVTYRGQEQQTPLDSWFHTNGVTGCLYVSLVDHGVFLFMCLVSRSSDFTWSRSSVWSSVHHSLLVISCLLCWFMLTCLYGIRLNMFTNQSINQFHSSFLAVGSVSAQLSWLFNSLVSWLSFIPSLQVLICFFTCWCLLTSFAFNMLRHCWFLSSWLSIQYDGVFT